MIHVMRLATLAVLALIGSRLAETGEARAETRVALVVGNGAYAATTRLPNPPNDARDMSVALKAAGFSVVEAIDVDRRKLDAALRAFAERLSSADVALFFYAGHGLQVGMQNYLVPVDARLAGERDLEFEAVKLDFVLRQMEIDREGKTTIVILDACRDNPLARNLARTMGTRSAAVGRGLAAAATGLGTFIAYSTQPGNVALDGTGRNSPFTAALIKHMGRTGNNLPATMIEVRKDVVAATDGRQVPWDHSALTGDFFFTPAAPVSAEGTIAPAPPSAAGDLATLQARLKQLEEDVRQREKAVAAKSGASAAVIPPVQGQARPAPTMAIVDNVRVEGQMIGEARQPNPAACRDSCEAEASCVAFQHGRRIPVMGQCQLFSRVDARFEDKQWRSGVRGVGEGQAGGDGRRKPPGIVIDQPPSRREKGFDIYDGLAAQGQQIKTANAGSVAGCVIVCRNTPGCVAAAYDAAQRGRNSACMTFRGIGAVQQAPRSSLMVLGE